MLLTASLVNNSSTKGVRTAGKIHMVPTAVELKPYQHVGTSLPPFSPHNSQPTSPTPFAKPHNLPVASAATPQLADRPSAHDEVRGRGVRRRLGPRHGHRHKRGGGRCPPHDQRAVRGPADGHPTARHPAVRVVQSGGQATNPPIPSLCLPKLDSIHLEL